MRIISILSSQKGRLISFMTFNISSMTDLHVQPPMWASRPLPNSMHVDAATKHPEHNCVPITVIYA